MLESKKWYIFMSGGKNFREEKSNSRELSLNGGVLGPCSSWGDITWALKILLPGHLPQAKRHYQRSYRKNCFCTLICRHAPRRILSCAFCKQNVRNNTKLSESRLLDHWLKVNCTNTKWKTQMPLMSPQSSVCAAFVDNSSFLPI